MADADTDRSQLIYRKQTAFGEAPPANPAVTGLRYTADTFKANNATVVSNEIRSDRMRTQQLLTGRSINGGFAFEFNDTTYDTFLESLLGGVFTTGVLKNGTAAQTYFMIERGLLDVNQFLLYRDCAPAQLNITAPSRGIVTGDLSFMGTIASVATTSFKGTGVLTAANTNPIMSSGPGINQILVNAAPIGVGVREIRLTIGNTMREREVVDSLTSREYGRGEISVTGQITMYFASNALYQYFLANTSFALAFTLSDNVSKAYDFLLPNCQPSDDALPVSAIDQDVIETFSFKAYRDAPSNSLIAITKRSF